MCCVYFGFEAKESRREGDSVINLIDAEVMIVFILKPLKQRTKDSISDKKTLSTPILEVDGLQTASNTSVCRHLAWRFGVFIA